jgi:hypothetical protein
MYFSYYSENQGVTGVRDGSGQVEPLPIRFACVHLHDCHKSLSECLGE